MGKPLISLDEYKERHSISSSEFDDKLTYIIAGVSQLVKSYCGRDFIDGYDKATSSFIDRIEYSNQNGYFYTTEFPVVAVTSVEYSEDSGTTYTAFTDFALDRQKDAIYIGGADVDAINAFKITYRAGYSKLPDDIKLACIDLVDYYYKNESTPRKSAGNTTLEYVIGSDMPSHIKRVLDLYRVLL